MADFRVQTGVFSSLKIVRLKSSFGSAGVEAVFRLWAYTAEHAPTGILEPLDKLGLEVICGMQCAAQCATQCATQCGGQCAPGKFAETLLELHFVDPTKTGFSVHDWAEHQPWLYHAKDRSNHAKALADARWKGRRDTSLQMNAQRIAQRNALGNAPYPYPLPIKEKIARQARTCDLQQNTKRKTRKTVVDELGFNPVAIWCEEFRSVLHKPPLVSGQHAKIICEIGRTVKHAERFRAVLKAYFADPTQHLADSGYPPSQCMFRINRYWTEIGHVPDTVPESENGRDAEVEGLFAESLGAGGAGTVAGAGAAT